MPLSLTKRIPNGAPLTATQHDANLTAIESAVNSNTTALTTVVTTTAFDAFFEGTSGGKKQVDWARITGKPALAGSYPFKATNSVDQSVSGNSSAQIVINTVVFDPSSVFNTGTYRFTAPVAGYYQMNYSAQVELTSGTPTGISMVTSLRVNSTGVDSCTLDNSGTGARIYKASTLLQLAAGDVVDLYVQITETGSATWKVAASGASTALSGFLVAAI